MRIEYRRRYLGGRERDSDEEEIPDFLKDEISSSKYVRTGAPLRDRERFEDVPVASKRRYHSSGFKWQPRRTSSKEF